MLDQDDSQTMFLLRSGADGARGARTLTAAEIAKLEAIVSDKQGKDAAILVADDSRTLRKLLVRSLNEQGYRNITEAADGREALDLAAAREFDLVLLDIEMPVVDGFEVLKSLKADPALRGLPVIVISGQDQEQSAVRCIEMGAEDYLPKPYNGVLLRARVTSSLEKKRLRDLDRLRMAELRAEKEQLQVEKEKSERLLLNILPRPIADRLKGGERTIADNHNSVTVLFADIVGFTHYASHTEAEELINLLNQVFTEFDHLVDNRGLEKIKTIGDSYMVVGGLPVPRPDHPEVVADLALGMLEAIQSINSRSNTKHAIRIGINTGPVMAGVIGRKKFSYDLWGSTVNLAARLESSGLPGQIHVSEATHRELDGQFRFTERGIINAKGVGDIRTYFLTSRAG